MSAVGLGERGAPALPLPQQETPLLDAVREAVSATYRRAHCPGHSGGRGAAIDIRATIGPEVFTADVWLPAERYNSARRWAEELAASAWGAHRAWLLGDGSTAGNRVWCMGTLRDGEDVIVARDAHTSVLAGLVASGARPRWVSPRVHPELGLPLGIDPVALENALKTSPGVRHVILSSPSYSGTCTDISACVDVARTYGAQVFVDSAWGAHLPFHPDLPTDAMAAGASGAVVSVHKSASALSGGALLLAGPGADLARLDAAVRADRSTSPLLAMMASIDAARRDLACDGHEQLAGVLEAAHFLRKHIDQIPGLRAPGARELGLPAHLVDPTKLVVDVSGLGHTGWSIERLLREGGTVPEGADARRVVFVLGYAGSTAMSTAGAVLADLLEISYLLGTRARDDTAVLPLLQEDCQIGGAWDLLGTPLEAVMTPRQAQQCAAITVQAPAAIGRVAAEALVPYPPGVPVVAPGEVITQAVVEVLRAVHEGGGYLHGCADPTAATVRVVQGR